MKINPLFLLSLILVLIVTSEFSCNKSEPLPPILSEKQLREAILQRIQKGQITAHNYEILLSALPQKLAPFDSVLERGSRLDIESISFSEAFRNYYHPDNYSLIANLSDYATDSTAIMHLFHRFERANRDSLYFNIDTLKIYGGFAWMWDQDSSEYPVYHLEAGVGARFHLNIQTNHPQGQKLLTRVLKSVDWEKLQKAN